MAGSSTSGRGRLAPNASTATGIATGAKSGGLVDLNIDGVVRSVQIARDLVVSTGDVVLVHKFGSLWAASSRLYTAAPADPPPVHVDIDPNPSTISGTTVIAPTLTQTYYAGTGWGPELDVRQGVRGGYGNATGSIFYGDKPASLSGVTVTAARWERVHRLSDPYASTASTIWLITETERPAGAPTRTSSAAGPSTVKGTSTAFTLPTSWGQALVDGTAGAIGFHDTDGSPWLQFHGRNGLPPAFTLVLDWTR